MDAIMKAASSTREHEFAIYRGDDFLDSGTAKELAAKYGCLPTWIKHMSTPTHMRKIRKSKKAKYTVKLGSLDTSD
jgi:hypothetical protein